MDAPITERFGGQAAPPVLTEPERLRLHVLKLLQRRSTTKLRTTLNIVKELTKGRS